MEPPGNANADRLPWINGIEDAKLAFIHGSTSPLTEGVAAKATGSHSAGVPSGKKDDEACSGEGLGTSSRTNTSAAGKAMNTQKQPCRYGRGCSHTSAYHRARYSHPNDVTEARQGRSRSKASVGDGSKAANLGTGGAGVRSSGSTSSKTSDGKGGADNASGRSCAVGDDAAGGFMCNECGMDFASVSELQLHMVRKTAWSNQGLIGCRVSCLVDNREWHEGIVTQYHKSGKHCVEYRRSGERRWMFMQRTAFYIVERAQSTGERGEVKEMEPDPTEGLAPIEKWHYKENISTDFCSALSQLHRAYGCKIQETGHKTIGHTCVTDRDKTAARQVKGSLLYGELLPRGVNKAMGAKHLNAAKAKTVFDLGMGTGKVAMQVFLQFPNLTRVYGVELSQARYSMGENALFALMELQPGAYGIKRHIPGQFMAIETLEQQPSTEEGVADGKEEGGASGEGAGANEGSSGRGGEGSAGKMIQHAPGRTLEFECGNLFDVKDIGQADIVLLETDVSSEVYPQLSRFLCSMQKGAQALTYLDLHKMWGNLSFPFRQVEVNRPLSDRFPTSWSVNRGHHFFLWNKLLAPLEISSTPFGSDEVPGRALGRGDSRRERQIQLIHTNMRARAENANGVALSLRGPRSGSGLVAANLRGDGQLEPRRASSLSAVRLGGGSDMRMDAAVGAGATGVAGARARGDGHSMPKGARQKHSKFTRLFFFGCIGANERAARERAQAANDARGRDETNGGAGAPAVLAPSQDAARIGGIAGRYPSLRGRLLASGASNRSPSSETVEESDEADEGAVGDVAAPPVAAPAIAAPGGASGEHRADKEKEKAEDKFGGTGDAEQARSSNTEVKAQGDGDGDGDGAGAGAGAGAGEVEEAGDRGSDFPLKFSRSALGCAPSAGDALRPAQATSLSCFSPDPGQGRHYPSPSGGEEFRPRSKRGLDFPEALDGYAVRSPPIDSPDSSACAAM